MNGNGKILRSKVTKEQEKVFSEIRSDIEKLAAKLVTEAKTLGAYDAPQHNLIALSIIALGGLVFELCEDQTPIEKAGITYADQPEKFAALHQMRADFLGSVAVNLVKNVQEGISPHTCHIFNLATNEVWHQIVMPMNDGSVH